MEGSTAASVEERSGTAHHYAYARGNDVTPDRDSLVNPAPKRARRRLETGNDNDNDTRSDDVGDVTHACDWGTTHNGGCRQGERSASTAHLLSESIIELLHVCTLIQVELNNNSTNNGDHPDEHERIKQEDSNSSSHAQGSRKS